MTSTLDLSAALGLRVANTEVLEVRIANTTVWRAPIYAYGFESGLDGWETNNATTTGITVSTDYAHSGSYSLRCQKTSGTAGARISRRTITGLTIGTTYRYETWVYRPVGSTGSAAGVGIGGAGFGTTVTPSEGVWTYIYREHTATATSHQVVVQANISDADSYYHDDVKVYAV